jgi:hypothetical protein
MHLTEKAYKIDGTHCCALLGISSYAYMFSCQLTNGASVGLKVCHVSIAHSLTSRNGKQRWTSFARLFRRPHNTSRSGADELRFQNGVQIWYRVGMVRKLKSCQTVRMTWHEIWSDYQITTCVRFSNRWGHQHTFASRQSCNFLL